MPSDFFEGPLLEHMQIRHIPLGHRESRHGEIQVSSREGPPGLPPRVARGTPSRDPLRVEGLRASDALSSPQVRPQVPDSPAQDRQRLTVGSGEYDAGFEDLSQGILDDLLRERLIALRGDTSRERNHPVPVDSNERSQTLPNPVFDIGGHR